MPSPFESLVTSLLANLIGQNFSIETLVKQMSFGLIDVTPPPGEPSLTSQLNNIVFQIQSLREHLDTANTEMISQNVDILAAVAALPTSSGPVTLPTIPPAGYGVDDGSIAGAVWAYLVGGGTQPAGDLMLDAGWLAINLGTANVRFPSTFSKYFDVRGTWFSNSGAAGVGADPIFPIANILSTDTLSDFLERESFYTGWTANDDGTYYVYQDPAHTDFKITTTITAAEFLVLRDGPAAAGAVVTAPVWPGLDLVTLSTPVALALGLTINEPMDGVIVTITGAPTKQGYFTFDDMLSYRNVGALAFIDDNGEAEYPQGLGFTSAVYSPKSMKQAAGVKVRTRQT
jgi:hypothetical protein